MTFGQAWGWGASREESRRIFDLFVEAGGNFIDTANIYTEGESERSSCCARSLTSSTQRSLPFSAKARSPAASGSARPRNI
ncbi:MAG TPA: aldo/keto reductase [Ktedonobacterales bacterium]|nr:aldo/keto reductase [Ktedonobacterales bacterium]